MQQGTMTSRRKPPRMAFSSRLLLQQILVVLFVVLLSCGVSGWLSYQRLTAEIGAKALAVAQAISENTSIRSTLAQAQGSLPEASVLRDGLVQQLAESVRQRTGALFIVVADRNGMRWSHPEEGQLGQHVTTSPEGPLSGQEIVETDLGSLGPSVRAKVPLRDSDGGIIGEVSVGYSTQEVVDEIGASVGPILGVGVLSLLLGVLGTSISLRNLRRRTRGLELEEISTLAQNQEGVLHGVDEGVLGLDAARRVIVCNDKARELLGLEDPVGKRLEELELPENVLALLNQEPDHSVQLVVKQLVLLINALKVVRGNHDLGWVIMVRDRRSVQALSRQLEAVSTLSSALRAQRHEFANRLHVVAGLLEIGQPDSALAYLRESLDSGPVNYPLKNSELLTDTYLAAFLGAKSTQAAERGVQLRIGLNTLVQYPVRHAQNATAVIGNLVDNAITAAVHGSNTDRWVEVELLSDRRALVVTVADSGDGVREADQEAIFAEGFTTSAQRASSTGQGEGIGLGLARQLARIDGGDVAMLDAGAPQGPGAVFMARVENVLELTEVPEDD